MSDLTGMPHGLPEPIPTGQPGSFTDSQQALRLIKALRLQRAGLTNQQIAETLGYASAAAVAKMIRDGVHKYASGDTEDYKIYFLDLQMRQLEVAEKTINNPGYEYDVKGDLVIGPGGRFLANEDIRLKAMTEYRHNIESIRRMLGVDAPAQKYITVAQERRVEAINRIKAEIEQIAEPTIEDAETFDLPPDE